MPVTLTSFVWVTVGACVMLLPALVMPRTGPGLAALLALAVSAGIRPAGASSPRFSRRWSRCPLMNLFQRRLDPVRAAVLYAFEPIWAALFGIAAGTDAFTTYLWLGGGLLLAGNLVAELGPALGSSASARAPEARPSRRHCQIGSWPTGSFVQSAKPGRRPAPTREGGGGSGRNRYRSVRSEPSDTWFPVGTRVANAEPRSRDHSVSGGRALRPSRRVPCPSVTTSTADPAASG